MILPTPVLQHPIRTTTTNSNSDTIIGSNNGRTTSTIQAKQQFHYTFYVLVPMVFLTFHRMMWFVQLYFKIILLQVLLTNHHQ